MEEVTIGRLTLQLSPQLGDGGRTQGTPAQVERLLNALEWRPPGYRPGQVWLIRRLAQLPPVVSRRGTRSAKPHAPTMGAQAAGAWAAQVEAALAELYRRALRVRPGASAAELGALEGVESVLFADRADWLALLTAATLSGRVWEGWCWAPQRAVTPGRDGGALLAAAWSSHAAHLPPALALLPPGQARGAVALLRPREVSRVVRALHASFALPDDVLRVALPEAGAPAASPVGGRPAAPWEQWTAAGRGADREEAAWELPGPQASYLLGLTLALSREPGTARSGSFAQAAAAWLRETVARGKNPAQEAGAHAGTRRPARSLEAQTPLHTPAVTAGQRKEDAAGAADASSADFSPPPERPVEKSPQGGAARAAAQRREAEEVAPPNDPFIATRQWGFEENTALGGVLFLIPALAWLGLPGSLGEAMGPWACVEALARALLGRAQQEEMSDDPIWAMLRALDGRGEGVLIGARGDWQGEFPLAPQKAIAEALREMGSLAEAAAAEEQRVRAALAGIAAAGVQRYAAQALACLLHLLRRALEDGELRAEDVGRRVLRQAGRLEITRTHVDLFLPLASADVQLRRAGLDRNPGWLPEYGYIVTVHYV